MQATNTDIVRHYQDFIECLLSGRRTDTENIKSAAIQAACDYEAAVIGNCPTEEKKSRYDAFLWLLAKSMDHEQKTELS